MRRTTDDKAKGVPKTNRVALPVDLQVRLAKYRHETARQRYDLLCRRGRAWQVERPVPENLK
jgi:hypothetical protein